MPAAAQRSRAASRASARLAAVQALYQREMEPAPTEQLLHEFHAHRLAETIDDMELAPPERAFFDDIVAGAAARATEIDALIVDHLGQGWTLDRLDRPLRAILRAGTYELIARADIPTPTVIVEYVEVARAFYDKRETGFVNGLLDTVAKKARPGA